MDLTPAEKSMLFQHVHCTKYLKKKRCQYWLERNDNDGFWYYKNSNAPDAEPEKATTNEKFWKHNLRFEIKDKKFSGVVVKVEYIDFTTSLGITGVAIFGHPSRKSDCAIPVATVYFRNGAKRIVPLECIQEYAGFNDGHFTTLLEKIITKLNFENPPANIITELEDGTVRIENTCLADNSINDNSIRTTKRFLFLNVRKREVIPEADDLREWFPITDDEYTQVMDILNRQMKEECGFVPDLAYGENNFDRLVNFTRYPFVPELNAFAYLYTSGGNVNLFQDIHIKVYVNLLVYVERTLQYSPDGVIKFFKICQIPYTPKTNRIFLQGHRVFAAFLELWLCGFRDIKVIEELISRDERMNFFCESYLLVSLRIKVFDNSTPASVLYFRGSGLYMSVFRKTLAFYSEKVTARLLAPFLDESREMIMAAESIDFLFELNKEHALPVNIIEKIGKEGFTQYNHDLLMNMYNDLHPECNEHPENLPIAYSDAERDLAWETDGYQFCLPEDTDQLIDIGAKMNICVGHLYREKALSKECTIVYAKKDEEYKLCIEVSNEGNDRFRLIQRSAFSNHAPKGAALNAFTRWCKSKNIVEKMENS